MPVLGDFKTKKIILPSTKGSDDEAWVEINMGIPTGVILGVSEKNTDAENSLKIVTNLITDWNFTDKSGKKAEINIKNIAKLPSKDFMALVSVLDPEKFKLEAAKKKS